MASRYPVQNARFKVANKKPQPDALLGSVKRMLGWREDTDSLLYSYLPNPDAPNLVLDSFRKHLRKESRFGDGLTDPKKDMLAAFPIPELTFDNGMRNVWVRPLCMLELRAAPKSDDSLQLIKFIKERLPQIEPEYPDIIFRVLWKNGYTPLMRGVYLNGFTHPVDLRCATEEEVEETFEMLFDRSADMRVMKTHFKQRVVAMTKAVRPIASRLTLNSFDGTKDIPEDFKAENKNPKLLHPFIKIHQPGGRHLTPQ